MPSLLLLFLLLILFDSVAATSPVVIPASPAVAMEYPEFDALAGFCGLCGSWHWGVCALINNFWSPAIRSPSFTEETFTNHPEWPRDYTLLPSTSPAPEPTLEFVPEPEPVPVHTPAPPQAPQNTAEEAVDLFNQEPIRISLVALQEHVAATYLPGDRTKPIAGTSRKPSKRHKPKESGFPCLFEQCGKVFDRNCKLTRHSKVHVRNSERPYKCKPCDMGFYYPKDLRRHQQSHRSSDSLQESLHCCPSCGTGFARRDNMMRHQRNQHPAPAEPAHPVSCN